jgi:hypothetical protein
MLVRGADKHTHRHAHRHTQRDTHRGRELVMLSCQRNVGRHNNINVPKTLNSGHICCHSAQNIEQFRFKSEKSRIKM